MTEYKLYNNEGCFFDKCKATTILKARQIFAEKYEGKYKITSGSGITNVRL